jgi:actin-related protein
MIETIKTQLQAVKIKFNEVVKATSAERKDIWAKIEVLSKFSDRYENGWMGEWLQNENLYHQDFNPQNIRWVKIDEKFIKRDLAEQSGVDLDKLRNRIAPLSKDFFGLKDFILSELYFITENEIYKSEAALLTQIENFHWGMNPGDYVRSRRPKFGFVLDPSVINRGLTVPPHIGVGEEIIFTLSLLTSYDNFEKLAQRLIRQLEIKSEASSAGEISSLLPQQALSAIIEKFHVVATQLKNRHNSKPTIIIEDEYDVQDLMNSLLRINFEDVRKEEYTPSYAGSSSRVDFLLKREKILVEVKKTRETLKDKEIGNQLIIDIARYKSHPDCNHLICFVYDPDNLVSNPRGLEDDLNRNTSEDMIVEVFIRP